ncbi:uncharacterized protein HD556DRAFT_1346178 [Suillus plorans]|uniref:Uncharacterized protein n=1 Tax=Suillus plorans TaxID=116603 RepID=A0A9P7DPL9_9AGAM|nr:uncharacterized protein HD556DRAFT_1346178 [Suillus plorans]KAG1799940.1 hypothetical protein HD556DRAFT_1346178 [Suillus plorans]
MGKHSTSLSFFPVQKSCIGNINYCYNEYQTSGTACIPIIPKFLPTHIDPSAPPFVFEVVSDVSRVNQAIGFQWHKVKDPESQVLDDLGC